ASRRIRVRFMTNAVKFHPSVYQGLISGSIHWVCTSVDAGTPSTYLRLKKRDHFLKVLENLTRYADAGSRGGGLLAIKYIFCDDNCGDDDIAGFTYAMLAIRPYQVWLTFDFSVLNGVRADSEDFGGYDFAKDIKAYAKMYALMKKHGLTPVHYTTGHLALVSRQGKILLDRLYREIEEYESPPLEDLVLKDFRREGNVGAVPPVPCETSPLRAGVPGKDQSAWSVAGKRVVLAPACPNSVCLLSDPEIRRAEIVGFLDRDRTVRGKTIHGVPIYGYEQISELNPDVVLVASPEQHRGEIVRTVSRYAGERNRIYVLNTAP
ncbi:MAG TPA: hypothetical protein VLS90_02950, partial [Thermodesulfobacteriota bacterium]|nr:hypothetical protein [Thermodesulfobacteriota bacterium]